MQRYLSAQSSVSDYNEYADGEYYEQPNVQTEEKKKWHTLEKVKTEESKNSIRIKEKTDSNVVLERSNVAYAISVKSKKWWQQ